MDSYALHLMGLAVKECDKRGLTLKIRSLHERWVVVAELGYINSAAAPTLAEALAALLDGLGVTVPERPSAERVAEMFPTRKGLAPGQRNYFVDELRDIYAREPLTVLALLEGGAS